MNPSVEATFSIFKRSTWIALGEGMGHRTPAPDARRQDESNIGAQTGLNVNAIQQNGEDQPGAEWLLFGDAQ